MPWHNNEFLVQTAQFTWPNDPALFTQEGAADLSQTETFLSNAPQTIGQWNLWVTIKLQTVDCVTKKTNFLKSESL